MARNDANSGPKEISLCFLSFHQPWTDRILHYLVPPEYERAADILPIINGLFVYIHATLVLAAITLKLVGTPGWSAETGRGWIRLLFSGNYLPRFSRAMLRDGQAYYL